ncbi:TetR/AcrR family transcriptional regulator [Lacrimispora sp.]|uniref:TetR/AcrR family transcriptional regulator n=1 Tax=Lacrimispora sp. TaxID=2719234 RepID=UPI002FD8A040
MPKKTFLRLRDEKQESIIRAAIHEFIENGFARAKIADIAQNAGVAKGSMYQYFEDKEELYVYCAEWGLETFMKKLDERVNIADMDVFEYFEDNVSKTEIINEEHEIILFLQNVTREPGLIVPSMKAMNNAANLYGKKLIQNSKKKGVVRTDIDDELLMDYFLAVAERFKMRWMDRYIDFTTEITEEQTRAMKSEMAQMLQLLKRGMGC